MPHALHRLAAVLLAFSFSTAESGACEIKKEATLPVTFHNGVPTVPITLNGVTINIVADTGAEITSITPEIATQLHLVPNYRKYLSGIRSTTAQFLTVNAIVNSLQFAGVEYKRKSVAIVTLPYKPPPSGIFADYTSILPLTGLLGADILSNYDIEYDAPGHTMTFYHVKNCPTLRPPWEGAYTRLSGGEASDRILLPVTLDGKRLTGLFDTGASSTSIALSSAMSNGVTPDMLAHDSQHEASGGGGRANKMALHRFGSFTIGKETLKDPGFLVSYFSSEDQDLLIGEDYMLARRFWLSYATHALFVQLRPEAETADATEETRLGLDYLIGHWVPKDDAQALKWLRKAAELGQPIAEFALGNLNQLGIGTPKNPSEAINWWRKAALQGESTAEVFLGSAYLTGEGVPKDAGEALKWIRKSAEQNNPEGETLLGEMYQDGRGVEKSDAEAFAWWKKAATLGVPDAEYYVGKSYATAAGIEKDDAEAVKWYQKAAEHGNEYAQFFLGKAYFTGTGMPKNYVLAYQWMYLASAQAEQGSHNQAELKAPGLIAAAMKPDEIAKAKALAGQWQRMHPPNAKAASLDRLLHPPKIAATTTAN